MANLAHGVRKDRVEASRDASTQRDAAALLKVSRRTVQRARSVREKSPELIEEVKAGRVRLQDAVRLKDAPEPVRRQAIEIARSGGGKAVNALAKKAKRADSDDPAPCEDCEHLALYVCRASRAARSELGPHRSRPRKRSARRRERHHNVAAAS